MVSIITDNPAVESCIQKILDLTRGAGTEFAPGLVLRVENGNMRTEAAAAGGRFLIRMPEECLIPPVDFRFGLEGDRLLAAPEDGITPLRAELMQSMLELFNLTGKIAQHKRTLPWYLAAAHPEILTHILRLRDNPTLRGYAEAARAGPDDAFTVETFFLSRTLAYRREGMEKPVRMLMPVVDFMNHHHKGSPYNTFSAGRGFGLAMLNKQPVTGSTECFARYGDYDALTTWLHYGFADEHAPAPPADEKAIDVSHIYYREFREALAKVKPEPGLAEARDIALRVCGLQLERLATPAAAKKRRQ